MNIRIWQKCPDQILHTGCFRTIAPAKLSKSVNIYSNGEFADDKCLKEEKINAKAFFYVFRSAVCEPVLVGICSFVVVVAIIGFIQKHRCYDQTAPVSLFFSSVFT